MRTIIKLKNWLLNVFFPLSCISCNETGVLICQNCLSKIEFKSSQACPNCKESNKSGNFCDRSCKKNWAFDRMIVCCKYGKNCLISKLIVAFKYRFMEEAGLILSEILKTQFVYFSQFLDFQNFEIVPVPIYKKRLNLRGFNQSLVFAQNLLKMSFSDEILKGKKLNLKLLDCLDRVSFKDTQAHLKRKSRLENLNKAFKMKKSMAAEVLGKDILLIDDVCTTGTTLNECAKVLRAFGAKRIYCMVLARG